MSTDNPLALDSPIEVAPGIRKRLGDCTVADLLASAELLQSQADHDQSQVERISRGQRPLCEWRDPSGLWCDNEAVHLLTAPTGGPSSSAPLAVCRDHHADDTPAGGAA